MKFWSVFFCRTEKQGERDCNSFPVFRHHVQFQKIFILSPERRLEFSGGGVSVRPKNLKRCMKLNWNLAGKGVLEKIPSVGKAWIFSGTTQYPN